MTRGCIKCGDEISAKRLEALPNTKLCIDCQGNREKAGDFQKHKIDIQPEITSWECTGVTQAVVRGSDV
jgi:hypothetical protein